MLNDKSQGMVIGRHSICQPGFGGSHHVCDYIYILEVCFQFVIKPVYMY